MTAPTTPRPCFGLDSGDHYSLCDVTGGCERCYGMAWDLGDRNQVDRWDDARADLLGDDDEPATVTVKGRTYDVERVDDDAEHIRAVCWLTGPRGKRLMVTEHVATGRLVAIDSRGPVAGLTHHDLEHLAP